MDIVLLMAIVAFLALGISLAGRSLLGRGPAALYGGLFAHPCDLGWPVGVQEEYDPRWGRAALGESAGTGPSPGGEVDGPVIEDVIPGDVALALTRLD